MFLHTFLELTWSIVNLILQPDINNYIMAPGVAILVATIPKTEPGIRMKPSQFGIKDGTSMACPHVTGVASLVKSVHHGWTETVFIFI